MAVLPQTKPFAGRRDFAVAENAISYFAVAEIDVTYCAVAESAVAESAISQKWKLL